MPEPQVQRQAEEEDLIQTKPLVDQITPWSKDRLKRKRKSFKLSERGIQPLKLLIILNHISR